LRDSFREQAEERQRQIDAGEIDDSPNEEVWFDNVTLEVNPHPSIYLVDYGFHPLSGPRLELHLRGSVGVHSARRQMGRIARYVEARHLQEEFPDISAITYTQLALGAMRVTGMSPALLTYIPYDISPDAYDRGDGAFQSANRFLARHKRDAVDSNDFRLDSQSLPTGLFVKRWRDFGVDDEV
jgi:hypothetical protein